MLWIRRLVRKFRAAKELDQDLHLRLDRHVADYKEKEEVRDNSWETHVDNLGRDFRYALRTLRKDRRFSLIALFALALGIGASTIVFSVVYNVFFHALPYKDFDRSVVIKMRNLGSVGSWKVRSSFSPAEVHAFREQNHVFEELIAYARMRPTYDDGKSIRFLPFGAAVTANTFAYLGVPPLLGRAISEEDGNPGAPPVFVMNYRLWQREFGGDPKILGTTFILNGKPTILVGIMPLQFNAFNANFWLPVMPNYRSLQMAGRLKPGVSVAAAGANLDSIAHRLHEPNPGGIFPEDRFAIVPQTMLDSLFGDFRKTLYALLAAVLLLHLIACSNVANLLFARATARGREIAMRATLGASRGRIIRNCLWRVLRWQSRPQVRVARWHTSA